MHSRSSPQALPVVCRQQPPSLCHSYMSPTSLAERARCSTAPPTEEVAGSGGSSPRATGPQLYGQPWNTPATLHSLAASLTCQSSGAVAERIDKRKTTAARLIASPSHSPSCTTTAKRGTSAVAEEVLPTVSKVRATSSSQHPISGTPALLPESTRPTAALRAERLGELEDFLERRGGRRASMEDRYKACKKALSLLSVVYPPLSNVARWMHRYIEDLAASLRSAATEKAEALREQQKVVYAEFEKFFEGKIRELMLARQQAEAVAKAEHDAAFALREERDAELMAVKEELLQRMNRCERTEDQFRDFRHLIASVYQMNQKLNLRIEQLEDVLALHNMDVPPASSEVCLHMPSNEHRPFLPGTSRADGGDRGGSARRSGHNRPYNLPVQFMAAAKQELVKSRLKLQEELLHSAFDDHSAYRMRVTGLTQQNLDLTFKVSELEQKVEELYTYIHEKRFARQVDEQGNDGAVMTPRPRGVPLALHSELGIELRHSTARILSELSTVAINIKHQLNTAILRARQLHTLSAWLDEGSEKLGSGGGITGMLERVSETAVIPVFPVSSWPLIPHFLRTNISPNVTNYFWTETQTACILYTFFKAYRAIRRRARFVRDSKMLAPRLHQLFEHREVLLTQLDARKEDAAAAEENVPFGYVVTQFVRDVLANLSPQNMQAQLPLVLPGTVALRLPTAATTPSQDSSFLHDGGGTAAYSPASKRSSRSDERAAVKDCPWTEPTPIVELELARFSYNLWYSAVRYQPAQPLCELFLKFVDGQMPIDTFDLMERVLGRLRRCIERLDGDSTRRFPYARLVKGMVRSVADMDAKTGLRAVQAVAQTFEANHMPLYGGLVGPVAVFADETYCMRETLTVSFEKEVTRGANSCMADSTSATAREQQAIRTRLPFSIITREVPLPTSFTASSPPSMLPPLGASCIVRFSRLLVYDTLETLYNRIEATLCPLVEESEVVLGLYLLPLPRAKVALAALDDMAHLESIHAALVGWTDTGEGKGLSKAMMGRKSVAASASSELTAETTDLLNVKGLTHAYVNLLQSRKMTLEDKRTEERQVTTRMVDKAVQGLPHFKTSTHFPFRSKNVQWSDETRESANDDGFVKADAPEHDNAALTAAATVTGSDPSAAKKRATKDGMPQMTQRMAAARHAGSVSENGSSGNPKAKAQPPLRAVRRSNKRTAKARLVPGEDGLRSSAEGEDALRSRTAEALLAASDEGDLVEWYSLRYALRRTLPSLPWQIFQPDEHEQGQATETAAPQSPTLPVLSAYEEEAPT
ncbi:hypothetical protein LSCM1_02889 [Leishmania martiniquensis]|uniref:Uncharacterized protein n=1 Tax=Leishmania martiniquensis TaxID=1580590 RepID=A0A836KQI1_9TRYP|nr:hypothetical protein LSCM1_02889 [Leishmania martiniquensis]